MHVADYDMRVRFSPEAKTLEGQQRIVWRNPAPEPVGELWFHLYLNAFKNSKSTFFVESGGQLRGDRMAEDGWGWVEVRSIRRADGVDLAPGATFEHPDDDNADDRTVWRVPLPEPVPPGGEIALDVAFEAKLPRIFARTGYFRDYFLAGQWFPKLGVYEPAGHRGRAEGGWNCHQFHANSEFYADFGHYRVEITLPKRFVVGATGKRVERRENPDGTSTHVFEQGDVVDFAWTASPRFLEVKATFSAEKDVTAEEYAETARLLGRSLDEVRLSDVEVTVLLQPEHAAQADRHVRAAKAGDQVVRPVVRPIPVPDPDRGRPRLRGRGLGRDGVPHVHHRRDLDALQPLAARPGPRPRGGDRPRVRPPVLAGHGGLERVRGVLARRGLQQLLDRQGHGARLRPVMVQALGLRLGELESARAQNSVDRMFDRIRSSSWGFSSSGNYGFNSYARTQLTLLTFEGLVGAETMARVMRTYHERWRFRHPRSEDFYDVVAEVAGPHRRAYFERTVERPGVLDDEVASVKSERVREPRGVFGEGEKDDRHHEGSAPEGGEGRRGGRPALAHDRGRAAARRAEPADLAEARVRGRARRRRWRCGSTSPAAPSSRRRRSPAPRGRGSRGAAGGSAWSSPASAGSSRPPSIPRTGWSST